MGMRRSTPVLNHNQHSMQKYFNLFYGIVLLGLIVFVIKLQLFNQVNAVQKSLSAQEQTVGELRADVANIVTALNEQINANADQAAPAGSAPAPEAGQ